MAINILTGKPGNGKTYVLAYRAKEWLDKGLDVYSNFKLNYTGNNLHYWENPKDLTGIEKGIIVMDEAHVYFNSRDWTNLDKNLQRKLQQHRKDGLHIWGTVQNEARLDVIVRELVNSYFVCHKIIGSGESAKKPWGVIKVHQYYPEDIGKREKISPFSSEWFFIRSAVCNFYDTLAKIDLEEPTDEITVRYKVCPHCQHKKPLS